MLFGRNLRSIISSNLVPVALIIAVSWFRLLPHPANFTPILALAFFSGARLKNLFGAIAVPILTMLLTDVALGFHDQIPGVYGSLFLIVLLGRLFNENLKLTKTISGLALSSAVFFAISNAWVWWFAPYYAKDLSGLLLSYELALPFYPSSLTSTVAYGVVMFAVSDWARSKSKVLA